jgi:hypothetical protein
MLNTETPLIAEILRKKNLLNIRPNIGKKALPVMEEILRRDHPWEPQYRRERERETLIPREKWPETKRAKIYI